MNTTILPPEYASTAPLSPAYYAPLAIGLDGPTAAFLRRCSESMGLPIEYFVREFTACFAEGGFDEIPGWRRHMREVGAEWAEYKDRALTRHGEKSGSGGPGAPVFIVDPEIERRCMADDAAHDAAFQAYLAASTVGRASK